MVVAPVPPVSRAIISIPGTALGSAMACRVCRGIMLGSIPDDLGSRTTAHTTLRFARQSHHSDVLNTNVYAHKTRLSLNKSHHALPLAIEITQNTESDAYVCFPIQQPTDFHGYTSNDYGQAIGDSDKSDIVTNRV